MYQYIKNVYNPLNSLKYHLIQSQTATSIFVQTDKHFFVILSISKIVTNATHFAPIKKMPLLHLILFQRVYSIQ